MIIIFAQELYIDTTHTAEACMTQETIIKAYLKLTKNYSIDLILLTLLKTI